MTILLAKDHAPERKESFYVVACCECFCFTYRSIVDAGVIVYTACMTNMQ